MRPAGPGRWKLWHLATSVLVAALACGAVRAVAVGLGSSSRGANALVLGAFVAWLMTLVAAITLGFARGSSRRRRGRPSGPFARLRRRGIEAGGLVGFLTWAGAFGLELVAFGFAVLAIALGLTALVAWRSR